MCACHVPSGLYFHRPSGEHRVLCIGEHPPPVYKYFRPPFEYGRMPDEEDGEQGRSAEA
ncbi:hypothetical protein ACP70R_028977 [Stipagrostis hirtigluma subsp. patula]